MNRVLKRVAKQTDNNALIFNSLAKDFEYHNNIGAYVGYANFESYLLRGNLNIKPAAIQKYYDNKDAYDQMVQLVRDFIKCKYTINIVNVIFDKNDPKQKPTLHSELARNTYVQLIRNRSEKITNLIKLRKDYIVRSVDDLKEPVTQDFAFLKSTLAEVIFKDFSQRYPEYQGDRDAFIEEFTRTDSNLCRDIYRFNQGKY